MSFRLRHRNFPLPTGPRLWRTTLSFILNADYFPCLSAITIATGTGFRRSTLNFISLGLNIPAILPSRARKDLAVLWSITLPQDPSRCHLLLGRTPSHSSPAIAKWALRIIEIVLRQIEGLAHCRFIWRSSASGRFRSSGLRRWSITVFFLSRCPSTNPSPREVPFVEVVDFYLVLPLGDFEPFHLIVMIAERIRITISWVFSLCLIRERIHQPLLRLSLMTCARNLEAHLRDSMLFVVRLDDTRDLLSRTSPGTSLSVAPFAFCFHLRSLALCLLFFLRLFFLTVTSQLLTTGFSDSSLATGMPVKVSAVDGEFGLVLLLSPPPSL